VRGRDTPASSRGGAVAIDAECGGLVGESRLACADGVVVVKECDELWNVSVVARD